MKITIDIQDELLRRAHRWKDLSVGEPGDPNPFERYTWAEMLALSYDRSSAG